MKKKLQLCLLVFLGVFLFAGCASEDLTKNLSDEEILNKSIEKFDQLENVEMNSKMNFKVADDFAPIDAELTGTSKISYSPSLFSNKTIVKDNILNQEDVLETYLEETQDGPKLYVFQNNTWFNSTFGFDPESIRFNPLKNIELFIEQNNGQVNRIEDEMIGDRAMARYVLTANPEVFNQVLNQGFLNIELANFVRSPRALKAIGKFKMDIWIDKSTLDIVRFDVDLTDNLRGLGDYLDKENVVPKELVSMFQNFELEMTYELNGQNETDREVVPLVARVGRSLN